MKTFQHAKEEFQSVIFTACALLTVSTIIYSLLASGDIQNWNIDDILSKVRGDLHSEHAVLPATLSKLGTLSDDYGASNRGGIRAAEEDSATDVESYYDSQPEGDSDPAPVQHNQWANMRIRSLERQRTDSDEMVPIGVPAVSPRSRANTMERLANKNRPRASSDPDYLAHSDAEDTLDNGAPSQSEAGAGTRIQPLIALPVQGSTPPSETAKKLGQKTRHGWQDVLVKELGQEEGSLVDGSPMPKKPTRLKADLIDLGSSEDRDDSGMATEASATSSNINGADDKAWRTDVFKDLDFERVIPQWSKEDDAHPSALDELLTLGASSSNLCPEEEEIGARPPSVDDNVTYSGAEATKPEQTTDEEKMPQNGGTQRRPAHVPHVSSLGDSPLSEHSSSIAKQDDVTSDIDNVEDILDAEISIPLESDGEPLVTRI